MSGLATRGRSSRQGGGEEIGDEAGLRTLSYLRRRSLLHDAPRLQDEFKALQRRLGKTVVLVTHDVPEALRLGDRVAVMHAGRVVQEGTAQEIREKPDAGFVSDFLAAALP